MKKFILVLVVLAFAVPALAGTVDITCTQASNSDEVIVSFTNTGTGLERVRAFALEISVDGGAIIESVECVQDYAHLGTAGYWVHPGTIVIQPNGVISNYGECVASEPDTGICENTIIVEMASLYAVTPPPQSGELLRFTIGKPGCLGAACNITCNVTITENAIRGGVVLENPALTPIVNISTPSCLTCTCATCKGDVNGNGWVELADMGALIGMLRANGGVAIQCGVGNYNACGDINSNGWMELADMGALIGMLRGVGGVSYACPAQPCP